MVISTWGSSVNREAKPEPPPENHEENEQGIHPDLRQSCSEPRNLQNDDDGYASSDNEQPHSIFFTPPA